MSLTIWNAIILNEIIEIHILKSRVVTTPAHQGKALNLQGLDKKLSFLQDHDSRPSKPCAFFKDIKAGSPAVLGAKHYSEAVNAPLCMKLQMLDPGLALMLCILVSCHSDTDKGVWTSNQLTPFQMKASADTISHEGIVGALVLFRLVLTICL